MLQKLFASFSKRRYKQSMFGIEKWWNRKWTGLAFVIFSLTALCFFVEFLTNNNISLAYNEGYKPTQPIPFSHKLHAGQYKMDCRYCHTAVEENRHASVPSLNICMNCHLSIKVESPWIQKLRAAYEKGTPVAWQKVHLLPDFVKFNHAPHIKALTKSTTVSYHPNTSQFRQSCATCHGNVETMETVFQKENLSMGWCIECHRQEENKPWLLQCATCHY